MKSKPFRFKTKPMPHQAGAFEAGRARDEYALLMYLGRGKSKVDIDSTAWAAAQGLLEGWVIVAPSGVHLNWHRQELPKHWPDKTEGSSIDCWLWESGKARSAGYQRDLRRFLNGNRGRFPILVVNVEAVDTDPGWEAVTTLLERRACKLTIDEASLLKSPKTNRTLLCARLGRLAAQRRILTGMPVSESPLDFYGQFAFLRQPAKTRKRLECPLLGFQSFYQFKHRYGVWGQGYGPAGRTFEQQETGDDGRPLWKNLTELERRVAAHAYVIGKDASLPPKIVTPPRYFELAPEQRRVYDELRDEFLVELEGGTRITAALALTRLLRLQQVACGFLWGEDGTLVPLVPPGKNPRIRALLGLLAETSQKTVIWCRFTEDIEQVLAACVALPGDTVTYYGRTLPADRRAALEGFQTDARVRRLVGSQQAGGRGVDMHAAWHTVYYSNYFSNELRLNSEERVHRHGLDHPVTQTDLVAVGTVDEPIVEALAYKANLATTFMANLRRWLT